MSPSPHTPIEHAVGQIPRGLFLVTASFEGRRTGILAQWVQQCSHEPPMIMVAMRRGQPIEPLIRDSRHFVLCQVPRDDRFIRRRFADPMDRSDDPFDSLEVIESSGGAPILTDSVCYLDCELVCQLELEADHRVLVGQVHHGEMLSDSEPAVFIGLNGHCGLNGDSGRRE